MSWDYRKRREPVADNKNYNNEYSEWEPPLNQPPPAANPETSSPDNNGNEWAILFRCILVMSIIWFIVKTCSKKPKHSQMSSNRRSIDLKITRPGDREEWNQIPVTFSVPQNSTVLFRQSPLNGKMLGFDTMGIRDTRRPSINTQGTCMSPFDGQVIKPASSQRLGTCPTGSGDSSQNPADSDTHNRQRCTTDSVMTLCPPRSLENSGSRHSTTTLEDSLTNNDFNNQGYTYIRVRDPAPYVDSFWSMPQKLGPSHSPVDQSRPGFLNYDTISKTSPQFNFGITPATPSVSNEYRRRGSFYGIQ